MHKASGLLTAALVLSASTPLFTRWVPLSLLAPPPEATFAGNHAFLHQTGTRDPGGWGAYFRHHVPGYLVSGLKSGGELLPEGTYRYDFYFVRRIGHFQNLLSGANEVVRVEVYDHVSREVFAQRTFALNDFSERGKQAFKKSLTFSTWSRSGHRFEPRIFWKGMAGIALNKVARVRLDGEEGMNLEDKAYELARQMPEQFLDHGYVIVRRADGSPSDQGDAAIWTGIYAASLALRYKVTQDEAARRDLERSLWALHQLAAASPLTGTLVRFVSADGRPLAQPASKDTYTGFYYGVTQGLPYIQDHALRKALELDLRRLTDHFIQENLSFHSTYGHAVDLRPCLSPKMLHEALQELREKPAVRKRWITTLRLIRGYFWMHGQTAPASFGWVIDRLKANDVDSLERETLTVLNDVRRAVRKLQVNVHRSALVGSRMGLTDTPYMKLDLLLLRALKNLDEESAGGPFATLEAIKIFPSQSIHALHFLKAAAVALPKPNPYERYYRENLYEGEALLRTALQWHQIDEDLMNALLGETEANTLRTSSSHLSYLALHNLIQLEKDPLVRFKYQKLFETQYQPMRTDGNAMIDAMQAGVGLSTPQLGLAWWSLERYPMDRRGKGTAFWEENKPELVEAFGGEAHRQARDPLPPDLRPRDAFIWQRSARSIYGDEKDWRYPPVDYLFAYWLARSAASRDAVSENR